MSTTVRGEERGATRWAVLEERIRYLQSLVDGCTEALLPDHAAALWARVDALVETIPAEQRRRLDLRPLHPAPWAGFADFWSMVLAEVAHDPVTQAPTPGAGSLPVGLPDAGASAIFDAARAWPASQLGTPAPCVRCGRAGTVMVAFPSLESDSPAVPICLRHYPEDDYA